MQQTLTIGFLSKPLSPARPPVVLIGEVSLTRALGLAGIPVVLAAWSNANIALASRYVWGYTKLPPIDDEPAVIARLVELGRLLHENLGPRVPLFFGSDDEIRLVAGNHDALRRHYLLLANEWLASLVAGPKGPTQNKVVKRGCRGAPLARRADAGILVVFQGGATQRAGMDRRPQRSSYSAAGPKVHTFAWTDPGPFVKDSWRFLQEMVRKRWRATA